MKKLKVLVATVLTAILIFALASCGAGGAVSGYVNAVKKGDATKAATFVVDGEGSGTLYDADSEIDTYMWKKTAGAFSYKVVSETEKKNDAGEVASVEIKISWEVFSYAELKLKTFTNEKTKDIVDATLKSMTKKADVTTVTVEKNAEGKFLLTKISSAALYTAITGIAG